MACRERVLMPPPVFPTCNGASWHYLPYSGKPYLPHQYIWKSQWDHLSLIKWHRKRHKLPLPTCCCLWLNYSPTLLRTEFPLGKLQALVWLKVFVADPNSTWILCIVLLGSQRIPDRNHQSILDFWCANFLEAHFSKQVAASFKGYIFRHIF